MGGIIWIASYPKSGNTWMRAFLHNLLRNPDKPVPINELTQFTLGDTLAEFYEAAAGRPLDGMTDEDFAALRPKVHRWFTTQSTDSVFVKTHMALAEVGGASTITMECTAGGIHIVRDPRDVALSAASHFGTDVDGAITIMNSPTARSKFDGINAPQYYGTWSQHVSSWMSVEHKQFITVRYEDMLERPGPTFGRVAKFLRLKPPPQRLVKAIRFSSFDVLQKQEKETGFIERSDRTDKAFFRSGQSGQWRHDLTAEQIKRIEDAHADVMRKLGYVLSSETVA